MNRIVVARVHVVIFVTAYDQFAVRAFEAHALDYLLKPFDDERFEAALHRARERIRQQQAGDLDRRLRPSFVREHPRLGPFSLFTADAGHHRNRKHATLARELLEACVATHSDVGANAARPGFQRPDNVRPTFVPDRLAVSVCAAHICATHTTGSSTQAP